MLKCLLASAFAIAALANSLPSLSSPDTEPLIRSEEGHRVWKRGMQLCRLDENMLGKNHPTTRDGILGEKWRWPNATVPYVINGNYDSVQLGRIHAAFQQYHDNTCVRFVPHTDQEDYVEIDGNAQYCSSPIGRQGGKQIIGLHQTTDDSTGCVYNVGSPTHEMMHAVGFSHEHMRRDRDDYINIFWENVEEYAKFNFEKDKEGVYTNYSIPYDYHSVMQYPEWAFGKDGKNTMEAKEPNVKLGNWDGLSPSDIKKINIMYNCTTANE